jgi:hypothetical protein
MTRIAIVALGCLAGIGLAFGEPVRDAERERPCPDVLRGVALSRAVVDGGVTLTFTTQVDDHVVALRELIRYAGQALEEHTNVKHLRRDELGAIATLPPLHVRVHPIGAGARVTVRTTRRGDVVQLRQTALAFERYWRANRCVSGPVANVARR